MYGPRFKDKPSDVYAEMRRQHGPVAPILLDGDVPAWLVIGYREVHHVLSNDQLYARDPRRWREWPRVPADWPLISFVQPSPAVLHQEGAEHRRRSGAISEALFGIDQLELRRQSERIADQLIDSFVGKGEAELVSQYAIQLPLLVMAKVYGINDRDAKNLLGDMLSVIDGHDDMADAYVRLFTTMTDLMERNRANPGPFFPTRMLQSSANLTDEEINHDLMVVMIASHRPMADWLGNTLRLMLTEPRFAMSLAGGRSSVGQALNEVLWEETPTQNNFGRWATRNVQLGGQNIQAGDLLVIGLAAANSDPLVRPNPHELPADNQAQLSFSHGEHKCPYPAEEIADVIVRAAVEVLLDRLPDVALAVHPSQLEWRSSVWMRSLDALPVEFTPTVG